MGTTQAKLEVYAYLSSHNSDQDRLDDSAWEEFCNRVEAIAREHRYDAIRLDPTWYGR